MRIELLPQEHHSVAVARGPLVYALLIHEDRKVVREHLKGQFHTYEIRPASAWNYALLLDDHESPSVEISVSDSMPTQPFYAAEAPIRLRLQGARTDQGGWGTYLEHAPGRAVSPPPSPINQHGDIEDLELVPYGSTEIRITCFPWFRKISN